MLDLARSLFRRKSSELSSPYLLGTEEFDTAAAAERMRVDRNHSMVSLLMIDLPAHRRLETEIQRFERTMAARLRLTDTAGLMRDGRLGILLPDTPASGAWKVAADLCDTFPVGGDRPDCEVVVYPEHPPAGKREATGTSPSAVGGPAPASDGLMRAIGNAGASEFEKLFIDPCPTWKRTIDIVGSTIGLLLAVPVIASAAVLIKLTSRGPAFFFQEREGLAGRRFRIWKLRTMRTDAEALKADLRASSEQDGPAFKMRNDPRITRIGRFLRKTSIDELPQLWNVLRGEMSMVGPRPLPIDESLACQPWQRRRLHVNPGITCTWQIYGRNMVAFDEWIRMDLDYAARQSPLLDVQLVLKTGPALVLPKGQ
ncbi:sugar transferase [Botrimarina hoheduenensis]|nr:sugar transferase [Botrimarina hoheduenensis]